MNTREIIHRLAHVPDPSGRFAAYLAATSFYADPASVRYHGSYPGGLADHTLGVLVWLVRVAKTCAPLMVADPAGRRALVLAALGHDLCKIGTYKESSRNVKDERGVWQKVPCFEKQPATLSLGHGDSSIWTLAGLLGLNGINATVSLAIRWHMGAFHATDAEERGRMADAMTAEPLVILLQTADLMDTFQTIDPKELPGVAERELADFLTGGAA